MSGTETSLIQKTCLDQTNYARFKSHSNKLQISYGFFQVSILASFLDLATRKCVCVCVCS